MPDTTYARVIRVGAIKPPDKATLDVPRREATAYSRDKENHGDGKTDATKYGDLTHSVLSKLRNSTDGYRRRPGAEHQAQQPAQAGGHSLTPPRCKAPVRRECHAP